MSSVVDNNEHHPALLGATFVMVAPSINVRTHLLTYDRATALYVVGDEQLTTKQYVAYGEICHFYRAMHFSAKRGIAIACRLSV